MIEQEHDQESRTGDEERMLSPETEWRVGGLVGVVLAVSGILSALVGALTSFSELVMDNAFPLASVGVLLAIVGYAIGARRVGAVATVFATVALFFAVGVTQGVFPGSQPTDRNLPAVEVRADQSNK